MEAARVEAVEQYKASNEHHDELVAAHKTGMKIYQKTVKEAGLLKALKRHLGQTRLFTVEEPEFEEKDQNNEATSLVPKDQVGQDGMKG